jgi:hypothetical protein
MNTGFMERKNLKKKKIWMGDTCPLCRSYIKMNKKRRNIKFGGGGGDPENEKKIENLLKDSSWMI